MAKRERKLNREQAAAVRDLDHSLCVVAGAGCGKTTVLVQRYIRALEADRERGVGNLAAITFTENAAAEMRERIRRRCLERMAEAGSDAIERDRWLRRKRGLDVAPVSTFHSFCASMLRRYPIEAGIDPMFGILDEASGPMMLADAVSRTIKDLIDAGDADFVLLLRHHNLFSIRGMLRSLVGRRERFARIVEPALEKSDEEILARIREEVLQVRREAVAEMLDAPECRSAVGILRKHQDGAAGDKLEGLRQAALKAVDLLQKAADAAQLDEAIGLLGSLTRRKVGSKTNWPSVDALEEVRGAVAGLVDLREKYLKDIVALSVTDIEPEHIALVRAIARLARKAVDTYARAKADAGMLDYEDL
ncbi:MAG: UvrD-helicase domain-containing protein, partial [Planctomycetia bacterium]|nr:UvrD-helicase domain-containing protein [Planctomycetia bacterium]